MSKPREFDVCTMERGDKRIVGIKVTCSQCGAESKHPCGHDKYDNDGHHRAKRLAGLFTREGWLIGKRPQDDQCPTCIHEAARVKAATTPVPTPKREAPMAAATTDTTTPREMGKQDKRLIIARLEEVYADEKTGYTPGWNDEKVAKDLGVPRAWITAIRNDLFGAEGLNPEVRSLIDEAKAVETSLRRLATEITTKADQLHSRIDRLAQGGR